MALLIWGGAGLAAILAGDVRSPANLSCAASEIWRMANSTGRMPAVALVIMAYLLHPLGEVRRELQGSSRETEAQLPTCIQR